jgi:hypothetical protein
MKTDARNKNGSFSMKRLQALPLVLGLLLAGTAGVVSAQGAGGQTAASPTRAQVKMEREEFLKTHRWDAGAENWVMKPEFEAPGDLKSRAEVKAAREEFLRNTRWDPATTAWVPLAKPRDLSTMTREQVRAETQQFARTHHWDEVTQNWVEQAPSKKKK